MGSKIKRLSTGFRRRLETADPHVRVLYAFNALCLIGSTVYGLYYGIFLYKQTFSLSVLAIDGLLGGVGCWLGYMIGVILVRRHGYGTCLKIAFGAWTVVCLITALLAGHIAEWFMVLAVLKALPAGMYAATVDTMMLRDIKHGTRNSFLQMKLSFEFLAAIVLPSLVGALISYANGYELAFVLAGCIYLLACFMPVKLTKPELSFDVREVMQTFRRPLYLQHAANRTAAAGFNQLNGFVVMIIPFLILKDELKIGLWTSGIALLAGIVSMAMRRVKPRAKVRYGYVSYTVRAVASLSFVVCWSAPVLIIWQLINKLATPLHDPLQQGLDIHNDSLIMGSEVREKALHINVLNNTLLLFGTITAYGLFFLITKEATGQQRIILPVLIMSFAAWRFINLAVSVRINRQARALVNEAMDVPDRLPLGLVLRRLLYDRLAKFQLLFGRL